MRSPARGEALRGEAGFTLIETVVAAVATGILVAVALAAYLIGSKAVTRWQTDLALDRDVHLVTQVLRQDLARSVRAVLVEPDSLVLTRRGGGLRTILLRDSAVYRDSVRMTDARVRVSSFQVIALDPDEAGHMDLRREPDVFEDLVSMRIDIELADGRRTVSRSIVHVWREAPLWPVDDDG